MEKTIAIIGLGYVGLPLACLFANEYEVIGFDIDESKVKNLNNAIDNTGLCDPKQLKQLNLSFTNVIMDISKATYIIITIPTNIDENNNPDLSHLKNATGLIAAILKKGTTVIYESTVYPGLTEEICIPILEAGSGLVWKNDFNVGYSPERINPGDLNMTLSSIKKIISADTEETLEKMESLYGKVIKGGLYKASSIKVAEAAKVIENAQRDLNIAFVNELALIFDRMKIDTREVLAAAGSKWNFLKFEPGLVGGQCISVDPYYLTYKAETLGYTPKVILSGRSVNNHIGRFISEKILKILISQNRIIASSRVLIMGCTFKENINDSRNSKVFDIVKSLAEFSITVDLFDPIVDSTQMMDCKYYLNKFPYDQSYDSIVVAVKHDVFVNYNLETLKEISVNQELNLIDVKAFYNAQNAKTVCKAYWRL